MLRRSESTIGSRDAFQAGYSPAASVVAKPMANASAIPATVSRIDAV
jgi:hypothetical protein